MTINKKIKFFDNFIEKKFKKNSFIKASNEINGYNYFKNKNVFFLAKRIKIIKKKNYIKIFYQKYQKINKLSYFKIKEIYNLKNLNKLIIKDVHYSARLKKGILKIKNKRKLTKIWADAIDMLNCNKILNAASHGDFVHYNILQDRKKIVTIDFEYFEKRKILSFDLFNWYFTPLFTNINRFKLSYLSNFLINLLFYFLKKTNFLYNYKINKIFFNDKYFFYFLIEKYIFYYNEAKKNIKNKDFLNSINLILEKHITLTSKKYINKFNHGNNN